MSATMQCFNNRHWEIQKKKMKYLIDFICDYYELNNIILIGKTQDMQFVWARHVAMAIAAENKIHAEIIAKAFNRDRSTVPYAHKKVKDFCSVNKEANSEVKYLVNNIKEKWINNLIKKKNGLQ